MNPNDPNEVPVRPLGQTATQPLTNPDAILASPTSDPGKPPSDGKDVQTQLDPLQKQTQPQAAPQQARKDAEQQLRQEIGNSNEILVQATSVFPFAFFPDTLTVDRGKLTITKRTFFALSEVMSVRIEDLLHVSANVGPLFGCIKISNRFFDAKKPYEVDHLRREDALKVKRILQGYIIATQKQIDCSAFDTKELADMLNELGKSTRDD
jgi:hypothetical protein